MPPNKLLFAPANRFVKDAARSECSGLFYYNKIEIGQNAGIKIHFAVDKNKKNTLMTLYSEAKNLF